jgi:hypothetical protein
MKIRELFERVIKTPENSDDVDVTILGEEVGLSWLEYADQTRLTCYYASQWLCTDTMVGTRLYFLDDEPVCMSYQPYRKSQETFSWVSREAYDKTRSYLDSFVYDYTQPKFLQLDEEIGDVYSLSSTWSILPKDRNRAILLGLTKENVVITGRPSNQVVAIRKIDGTEMNVGIEEIVFPLNVKGDNVDDNVQPLTN